MHACHSPVHIEPRFAVYAKALNSTLQGQMIAEYIKEGKIVPVEVRDISLHSIAYISRRDVAQIFDLHPLCSLVLNVWARL